MKKIVFVVCGAISLLACIENFNAETQVFEGVLVIDARLSDEEKQHEVLLSRARPFEQDSIVDEENAIVKIKSSDGNIYDFREIESGRYQSSSVFGAKPNVSYELEITTASNKLYRSDAVSTPKNEEISKIYVEKETNDLGEDGLSVFLDADSNSADVKYLRYEYEETYKIIAPDYDPFEFEIIDDIACVDGDAFEVGIKPREIEQRVCFGNNTSKAIIQTSTDNFTNNIVSKFPIRFIKKNDFIISHRYSILVRQHSQTLESFSYFEDLEAFSSSDNVFTEVQSGFLNGNIKSIDDADEKVLGYFQVTSVTEERLFFNYTDFFPEEPLPDYPIACEAFGNPRLIGPGYHCTDGNSGECDGNCTSPLIQAIKANSVVFFAEVDENDGFLSLVAPYYTKPRACGDCTVFGSIIKPNFWIE